LTILSNESITIKIGLVTVIKYALILWLKFSTLIFGGKTIPINPNNGNDKIHIDIPEWIKNLPTGPFSPHTPYPEQIWYNQEPDAAIKVDAHKHEERRYVTEVSCTGDPNCITTTHNPNDCVYTGDFRDVQTSFNDK
jgi:hypothetical protein